MKKIILIIILLSGCSYKPVVDLRASEEKAQLLQRDTMECKQIIKENISWFRGRRDLAMQKCLNGRGHSVLNSWN